MAKRNPPDNHGTPAFQFYPKDFVTGVAAKMTNRELGAYVRLLCHEWIDVGLPSDETALAMLAHEPENWSEIAEKVMTPFSRKRRTKIYHPRHDFERERQRENRKRRQEAGRKGGNTKRNKRLQEEGDSSNATDLLGGLLQQCSSKGLAKPSSSSSSSVKYLREEEKGRKEEENPPGSPPVILPTIEPPDCDAEARRAHDAWLTKTGVVAMPANDRMRLLADVKVHGAKAVIAKMTAMTVSQYYRVHQALNDAAEPPPSRSANRRFAAAAGSDGTFDDATEKLNVDD